MSINKADSLTRSTTAEALKINHEVNYNKLGKSKT